MREYPLAGQRTLVEPEHRLKSPAFDTTYPAIRNIGLIDPGAKAAMEEAWSKGRFEERDVEVFNIKNAYIVDECLILDEELRVISNASDDYTEAEIAQAISDVKRMLAEDSLPHFGGVGIVSKRRAINNYGHFLMEMVPMALIAYLIYGFRNPCYILHRLEAPMMDVLLRAARLMGIRLDYVFMPGYREPMHFENLVIVRGLTKHGTYMSPLCVTATAEMGTKIPKGNIKRLFIKRVPRWRRGRALINEDQICMRLMDSGFEAVEPGAMTLEQQIAAFRGAELVVGVMGAALTNIVFCQPGARVVSLVPANFPDTFFWFIATHKGLSYTEIRGDQITTEFPAPTTANFLIRESDILFLKNLGKEI
jgi:capsular polysaccharide biosynthesis protein